MISGLLVKLKTLLDNRDAQLKQLQERSAADTIVEVLKENIKPTGAGSVTHSLTHSLTAVCFCSHLVAFPTVFFAHVVHHVSALRSQTMPPFARIK